MLDATICTGTHMTAHGTMRTTADEDDCIIGNNGDVGHEVEEDRGDLSTYVTDGVYECHLLLHWSLRHSNRLTDIQVRY